MFSLWLRGILVGYTILFVSGYDSNLLCSNIKIENVYPIGKAPKVDVPGRYVVKSAKRYPLKIPSYPSYVGFCYESVFFSAWARCYNNVTVPSILKIDLTTLAVEISFADENCSTTVNCISEDIYRKFEMDFSCFPEVETRQLKPVCRSPLDDDPRCFFKDHNYFFHSVEMKGINLIRLEEICSEILPIGKPVALETSQEVNFIKNLIAYYPSFILTSGIKVNDSNKAFWFGWNLETDGKSIIPPGDFQSFQILVLQDRQSSWIDLNSLSGLGFVLCETDQNVKDFIHRQRQEESPYVVSDCCFGGKDGYWWKLAFAGESTTTTIFPYKSTTEHFPDEVTSPGYNPDDCVCEKLCDFNFTTTSCDSYNSDLNDQFPWKNIRCSKNESLEPPPNITICCSDEACKQFDVFHNIWIACPESIAAKEMPCPENSPVEKTYATWYCQENGVFEGNSPVYGNCDQPGYCYGVGAYGEIWNSSTDGIVFQNCPSGQIGNASWTCNNGEFVGYPDYSECSPDWLSDVEEMIDAGNDSIVIMNTINNYTKNDSKTGFRDIIDVTSKCVDLFHVQLSSNKSMNMFNDFALSYSTFLGNILTNASVWSDFFVENRINYTKKIIEMTEKTAFSGLNCDEEVSKIIPYNNTFGNSEKLQFFISYGTNPVGASFPLRNDSLSLEVKKVDGDTENNFAAVGLVFDNDIGLLMFPKGNDTSDKMINAPIISFSLATKTQDTISKLSNVSVTIGFKHLNSSRYPTSPLIRRRLYPEWESPSPIYGSSRCFYYSSSDWDPEGCTVVSFTEHETNCSCSHLSTISVLMDVHEYIPEPTLELLSMVCSGASIVSLFLTLLVFFGFECIKSERTTIGKHLCFCLLIGHIMLLTVMDKKFFYLSDEACSIVAVVFHYVFTAAFFWMAIEGHHLYRLVVVVFESDIDYKTRYLIVGYGIPVLVVGLTELISVASDEQAYGQDELCWLQTPLYVWAFTGPVIAITTFNLCILVITMRLAVVAKSIDGNKSNLTSVKLWLKGWSSLSTLLGVTWLIGLGYIQFNYFFVYAFVVSNGLQGVFIFLFRCVLNDQVRGALLKQYRTHTSQYEESKTVQVNATKSISRFGKEKSGSITTVHERRKSSVISSIDSDFENAKDPDCGSRNKLPCSQILQKIQKQASKRKIKKDADRDERSDGSLPSYSECVSSSDSVLENKTVDALEESFPPVVYFDFSKRYPPIEEEPDSLDGIEIDNARQNKY